jgi:GNAT superfamily N-acetyltransferase
VGSFTIVWADPGVVGTVRSLESDTAAFPVEGVRDWATDRGAEYLGGAYGHLIGRGMIAPSPVPPGTVLLEIDRDDEGHRALIRDLTAGCDADDIDAAEVEMDDLDPVIVGLIDGGGRLVGMAGERPWRLDPGFGDIGVLVRPDGRRRGHGRAAVAALCRWDFENGRLPLYRCTWDRAASRRLALSVGFRQVSNLAAVRFV